MSPFRALALLAIVHHTMLDLESAMYIESCSEKVQHGPCLVVQATAFRIGKRYNDTFIHRLQVLPDSGDGPTSAYSTFEKERSLNFVGLTCPADEGTNTTTGLPPYLGSSTMKMSLEVA